VTRSPLFQKLYTHKISSKSVIKFLNIRFNDKHMKHATVSSRTDVQKINNDITTVRMPIEEALSMTADESEYDPLMQ